MTTIYVPVLFDGTVTVEVPSNLSKIKQKQLAKKLALARILATTDNPDAPEDEAFEDYLIDTKLNELPETHSKIRSAQKDWDLSKCNGVSGTWTTQ